ncbi:pre-rRNA-processing protein TSR2 homolog [Pomacea canaliculata]|uniref:pre-rRNA-processing protein TSR2 homolog n=1 Tax=Pomacea canaliculata TaxID=400727 RepID=UPI000D73A22F|nr:pre-rRNA-processing protein TSR2 homolog [Pomacea canaliculata]
MAASFESTPFTQAVSKILNSWTALQFAVNHGIGGPESREKAEWMVTAICTWFNENRDIKPDELVDFLEDVLGDVFEDLHIEDDSIQMVASHICQSYNLIGTGHASEVLGILQRLPSVNAAQCRKAETSNEEVEMPDDLVAASDVQGSSFASHPQGSLPKGTAEDSLSNDEHGEGDAGDSAMDVEEEGWEVVQRGKKKK